MQSRGRAPAEVKCIMKIIDNIYDFIPKKISWESQEIGGNYLTLYMYSDIIFDKSNIKAMTKTVLDDLFHRESMSGENRQQIS